jgi:uncharacterized membrane protein (UPF0127 family)
MKKESRIIILDYILVALFLIGIIYMYEVRTVPNSTVSNNSNSQSQGQFSTRQSSVQSLSLLFARTPAEQELGLSQRASLPTDEGMLFIFDTPSKYAFWMKDMSFPIDMIWLDADFHIVYIAPDVSPLTYPHTFSPSAPSLYVLETNAGYASNNRLTVGETLDFVKAQVD